MLEVPAAIEAHAQRKLTQFAMLLKLTRAADSQVVGFTSFCRNLPYDDGTGAAVYVADPGMAVSAIKWSGDMVPDELEVTLAIDDQTLLLDDVEDGLWRDARATVYKVIWPEPVSGEHEIMFEGRVHKVQQNSRQVAFQLLSKRAAYSRRNREQGTILQTGCRWLFAGTDCGFQLFPAVWQALESVIAIGERDQKIGDVRRPTVFNGYEAECIQAGDTGAVEPVWPTVEDAEIDDGTARWRMRRAYRQFLEVDTVESNRAFTVRGRAGVNNTDAPDGFFLGGYVLFDARAENALFKKPIKIWTGATKRVEVELAFPRTINPGDQVELIAGCLKAWDDCVKRRNQDNGMHFNQVPGQDARLEIQRA